MIGRCLIAMNAIIRFLTLTMCKFSTDIIGVITVPKHTNEMLGAKGQTIVSIFQN